MITLTAGTILVSGRRGSVVTAECMRRRSGIHWKLWMLRGGTICPSATRFSAMSGSGGLRQPQTSGAGHNGNGYQKGRRGVSLSRRTFCAVREFIPSRMTMTSFMAEPSSSRERSQIPMNWICRAGRELLRQVTVIGIFLESKVGWDDNDTTLSMGGFPEAMWLYAKMTSVFAKGGVLFYPG